VWAYLANCADVLLRIYSLSHVHTGLKFVVNWSYLQMTSYF